MTPLRLFVSSVQKELAANGSVRRNPLLAEPGYLAQCMERMGTWTRDVLLRCRAAGPPEPRFEVRDGFVLTLGRKPGRAIEAVTAQEATQETQDTAQEHAQERILAALRADPRPTRKILAQRLGLSADGVKYHLTKLRTAGRIRHVGSTKAGRWEVLE
jgi:ATP-dependent DNA helicase RecG